MPDHTKRQLSTVLAFDFGLKRIGIATGDTLTGTATPRRTVSGTPVAWQAIAQEVKAFDPAILIVGLPLNEDGSVSPQTAAAQEFASELQRRFVLPVETIDERDSSLEANAILKKNRQSGQRRRTIRKEDLDSTAAAIILERWLTAKLRG
jgi:putative holliday junction resolvase